jgi:hypothetical protein
MANKNKKKIQDILLDMQKDILKTTEEVITEIPDIITFIEEDKWLGLGSGPNPIILFPAQKIILKVFYRGSRGNENLTLTEEEIEFCKTSGLIDDDPDKGRGDVLSKLDNGTIFRELVLVWGRRSGKDFLVSLIALYEAMRLLEIPGGDPYSYYGQAPGADISILTIAASNSQAQIAFREIRAKLVYSKYFSDKYKSEGLLTNQISLLTPKDKEDNKYFAERGMPLKMGSVKIEVGHSNPDTLVGRSCFVLILDEVASYRIGGASAGSGEKIYALLQPSLSSYVHQVPIFDEETGEPIIDEETGEQACERHYEGKMISISSPRAKEGKLWELWSTSSEISTRLACRIPTWVVHRGHTRDSLRTEFSSMSEEEFMMEFGADFSGTAGESMFPPDVIRELFKNNFKFTDIGSPGKTYFAHLDPATNSHNYALVVCHKEIFLNPETKKADFNIIVDLIKYWSPTPDRMIEISEVDDYVCTLKRRFHLGLVTYDQWNSTASIQKLRKKGIPAIMTRFNRRHKMAIYSELEELIKVGKLKCPFHQVLSNEMTHLQRRYDALGFKVYPKKDGDVTKTDDITDALAGAVFSALSQGSTKLPRGKMVNTGTTSQANNVVWRSAQGIPYGVGSGEQVAKKMERRASWPRYKR